MFLLLHSLSGALRYLRPLESNETTKSIQHMEKMYSDMQEETVCPTCKHGLDVVAPLPSEQLKRRSSAHNAYSTYGGDKTREISPKTRGIRIARARHKSDNTPTPPSRLGDKKTESQARVRLELTRNPSDPRFETLPDEDMVSGPVSTLPRTLSTSVLRIKQRRSFWEKFLK